MFYCWVTEGNWYFRRRCAWGTHPFPSRTRRLRPKRPMVLHWRRCGRVGGCQSLKKEQMRNRRKCSGDSNRYRHGWATTYQRQPHQQGSAVLITGFTSDQRIEGIQFSDDWWNKQSECLHCTSRTRFFRSRAGTLWNRIFYSLWMQAFNAENIRFAMYLENCI